MRLKLGMSKTAGGAFAFALQLERGTLENHMRTLNGEQRVWSNMRQR